MSVVVVVKKGKEVVIASDTLTSMGEIEFSSSYKVNSKKFIEYQGNYFGFVGASMSKQMLQHALKENEHAMNFNGIENIYSSLLQLHKLLKEKYYLVPSSKTDQVVEYTKLSILLANGSGIYNIASDRHVAELSKFWAIGSGMRYALGAMHSVYDQDYSAEEIARIGVEAACEFDKSCALPMDVETIILND